MNKLYNNRFIFIVVLSFVVIMVLAFGSIALTKRNTTEFAGAGYIISSNKVLEFASGTTYRINLNEKIVFTSEGEIYEVDQSSFIHYKNGSIALLKNGAFVDLKAIGEEIVPYYNITNRSVINKRDGGYTIKNGAQDLYFDDILLRVTEDKYLIAGKDIKVKVPGVDGLISGEYFELTFVEDGIILIENDVDSYQVTADGTVIYIGDKTVIDLNTKNVLYDGESRLNMSSVTIDGNENIDIVPEEEESTESGSGSAGDGGSGSGDASDGSGEGSEGTDGTGGDEETPTNDEVSIELVDLIVNIENMTGIFQVNNPLKLTGELKIEITNIDTNATIEPTSNMTTTGYLSVFTDVLESNNNYMLTIKEVRGEGNEIEYFQRMFTTNNFGISLKKVMISEDELNYDVVFTEESEVEEVLAELYDNDGNLVENSQKTITRENNKLNYINLDSNSTYTIKLVAFKINSVSYLNANGYINKTVKTLKQKPTIKSVKIEANDDMTVFNLIIAGIDDPDSSITNYTYSIYEDTDLENAVYTTTITNPTLIMEIGKDGMEANTNYRFKALIEYNDNEKVREIETSFSNKFISTGASVTFTQNNELTTFNTLAGEIVLEDPDCTVPMPGREMCDGPNTFTVSYYVDGIKRFKDVSFVPTDKPDKFIVENFILEGLSANTEYTMELNGDIIDEGERVSQVIIGNPFKGLTADIPTLKIVKKSDNESTFEYPINVTLSLESNSSSNTFIDQVKTMKVTLYALDASNNKIQIGNIVNLTTEKIKTLLYNKDYQMTNEFFGINNIEELLAISEDSGWAHINYIIEFTDAYDVPIGEITEDSNKIEIENNEVKTTISKSFLLNYYATEREATTALVTEILNKELEEKIKEIDGTTIAAYKIDATIYIEDILRQYYGVTGANNVINWDYLYYIFDKDGNVVHMSEKTKYMTHTFYLDDEKIENFDRGNEYKFGFQIVVSDGVYPAEPVIAQDENGKELFNPVKENPYIAMAIWESTQDSITYMYKITKDIDNALFENTLYIHDANGTLIDSKPITKSDDYQFVTFNNLVNSTTYKIMYKKGNTAFENGYTENSKGAFIFDGLHDITSDFTLKYEDSGNQLSILINSAEMVKRADAYSVVITPKVNSHAKEFVFTMRDLVDCNNAGINNCLVIDYKDLEKYQGANTTVSIKAFYENGLIGLNQQAEYFVFKDDANEKYLTVSPSGKVASNVAYPDGIYSFTRTDMDMQIKNHINNGEWNHDLPYASFKLSIGTGGVGYSNYGSFNPKVVKEVDFTTSDNNFYFSSIIPMVKSRSSSKINTVDVTLNLTGLTKTIIQNEFKSDDYKIYVELYEDEGFTNKVAELSSEIDLDDIGKDLVYKFDNLMPNHTYYYKVFAHILSSTGEYVKTELYDYNSTGIFEIITKSVSTYGVSDIYVNSESVYESKTSADEYMTRSVELITELKDTTNYKLFISVLDKDGNRVFDDVEIANEDLSDRVIHKYDISKNGFIFGENGYKLTITAITTDTAQNQLVLYDGEFIPHLKGDETITELREPEFAVTNRKVYVPTGENKYSMDFSIAVNDPDLVITNADYYVMVTDDYGNTFMPEGYNIDEEGFIKLNLIDEINTILTYKNLDPDSYYSITVKADTYRNNASLDNKYGTTYGYDYIETGSEFNMSLGTGTLSVLDNILTIDYKNASNLQNVSRITATVRKSNALVGTYEFTKDNNLEFINEDGAWKLVMNLKNVATSLNANDQIRVIIRYYAYNLDNTEGLVETVTYANYEAE